VTSPQPPESGISLLADSDKIQTRQDIRLYKHFPVLQLYPYIDDVNGKYAVY
jgi:hypothetical protein